jgi:hypothetical protein
LSYDNKESQLNPTIKKENEKNPTTRKFLKKGEDHLYHQEKFSSQPCNQEAPSFLAPQSGSTG